LSAFKTIAEIQDQISLVYVRKDFYINDVRVKCTESDFEFMGGFGEELKQRQLGGIEFPGVPSVNDITDFVLLFNETDAGNTETPFMEMSKLLMKRGVTGFTIQMYGGDSLEHIPAIEKETFVKQTFFRGIMIARQIYEQARDQKRLTLKSVKRVVQNFVDTALDETVDHMDLLLLLTELKNWQGYLFNHAVNTSVLSVAFGSVLGIGRLQLRNLGTAAMLADVGNAVLPLSVLDGKGPLDVSQQKVLEEHPVKAVMLISAFQYLDASLIEAVIAALYHHRGYKNTGYPKGLKDEVQLYAQIISLCDRYDAMTTPRPWRPQPMTPLQALEEIAQLAGTDLDPVLVKAFVNWMGAMPSGSVVMLPDGNMGLVVRPRSRLRERDSVRVQVMSEAAAGECVAFDSAADLEIVDQMDINTRHKKTAALLAYSPSAVASAQGVS
jgi:HD-GYP domain-containing protein (c-di-GMP phosphodiesterase class II)